MRGTEVEGPVLLESRPYELEALRESLRRMPLGVIVYEPVNDGEDFRILYANPEIERTKPFKSMQGRTYSEVWPEIAETGMPRLRSVLHTGAPLIERSAPLDVEISPGQIGRRYYTYHVVRIQLGGQPLLLVFMNDVTREQRVMTAIREARGAAQREAEISNSLLRAANEIARLTDVGEVASVVAQVLFDSLGHTRASVLLLDMTQRRGIVIASKGQQPLSKGQVIPLAPIERLDEAFRSGEALVFDFQTVPQQFRVAAEQAGTGIALIAPIQQAGKLIGALSVDDPGERREFTERDVAFAEGIASQTAVAIQNARSLQSVRERSVRWHVLARVAELTSSALDPPHVIEAALSAAEEHLGAIATSLWTFDARRELVTLVAAQGFPEEFMHEYAEGVTLDTSFPVVQAVRQGSPVLFERITDGTPLYSRVRDSYARYGIPLRSLAVVPLMTGGQVTGVMTLAWDSERKFDEGFVWFLTTLADHFARALENAHAAEDRALQARFAEALNRVNEAIHATLSPNEVLQSIVEEVSRALDVDATVVQLRRGEDREIVFARGVPDEVPERLPAGQMPLSEHIESTGEPLVLDDITTDPLARDTILISFGLRSVIALPLFIRSEVVGVVFIGRRRPLPFLPREIDFAREAVTAASLAMENASLYETQQRLADRLQQALLSMPEAVQGLEFAHEYRSATAAARVGGDFYDVFQIDREHVGIVMGDVAGKGLEAAVLTSVVRNIIRSHLAECRVAPMPGRTLEVTNEVLYKATSPESFITVFFGILDCRDDQLRYSNAGHTTPVLVRPDGEIVRLAPTGVILGAFPQVSMGERSVRFTEGDMLTLYTDGLTETRRNGEFYGEGRVEHVAAASSGRPPEEIVHNVMQDVLRFGDGELSDDVALLVLKRTSDVAPDAPVPAQHVASESGGAS